MRRRRRSLWICLLLAAILALSSLTGCTASGAAQTQENASALQTIVSDAVETDIESDIDPEAGQEVLQEIEEEDWQQIEQDLEETEITADTSAEETLTIDEDGSYTTKEDVSLYLHIYGKLPSNFITKKEAEKLGWQGGSLEPYAPGKCIGGNYFGNYEGLLPDGNYKECDIDTLGRKKRGAKRIIYSDDGRIYYTDDHYESFIQLY